MVYKCEACHAIFFEPYTYEVKENLDGENGIETRTVAECPFCGEEFFEEESNELVSDRFRACGMCRCRDRRNP